MSLRSLVVAAVLALLAFQSFAQSASNANLPPPQNFEPVKPGPVVIVISGASGPEPYRDYAIQLRALGYYAVLIDGREVLTKDKDGLGYLKKSISDAQASSAALRGKVAVVGFSQGGGGALLHATTLSEQVSAVVAYYPAVSWSPNMNWLAGRFAVPVLILAGEKDRYNSCCLIEDIRGLEKAAKARGVRLELTSYPEAEHGFNLKIGTFRQTDSDDAWIRTKTFLNELHPASGRTP